MQFQTKIHYEAGYALLNGLALQKYVGEEGLYVDPPNVTTNVSPLFCICDMYLLERIIRMLI
jgi:hypothetical protein